MSDNENQSKWFQKVDPNSKSSKRLKKIFTILLVAYLIVFLVLYTKNKYANFSDDILEKVGAGIETNIPIDRVLRIKKLAMDTYKEFLLNNDYQSAYDMLTDEYKLFCPIEEYETKVKQIDWSTFEVEDINAKNDYCYIASVIYNQNGETIKTRYLLYINKYATDKFFISPDKYIYSYIDQEFSKDDILLHIDECVIYIDKIVLKGSIKNTSWFSDINISSVNAAYGDSLVAKNNITLEIKKGDTAPIIVNYEGYTDYFIPDNIKIEKDNGEKEDVYSFYFKEAK